MALYTLTVSIWANHIIPHLIQDAIENDNINPIYNLRLVCKHYNQKIITIGTCERILHFFGLNEVVFDKSVKSISPSLIYLKDISVIIKLKTKMNDSKYSDGYYVDYEGDMEDCDQYVANQNVIWASYNNKINILNWWKRSGFKITSIRSIISEVSLRGHECVLDWWKQYCSETKIEFGYWCSAIDSASRNGHINILDWWLHSGLQLKYSNNAIDDASRKGHINILDWWLHSGLQLKYSKDAINNASNNNHINILDWWLHSGLQLKYSDKIINDTSKYSYIDTLNWWLKSGLDVIYSDYTISAIQSNNNIILMWWHKYGLDLIRGINTSTNIHKWLNYFIMISKHSTITIDCASIYCSATYEWDYANARQIYLDTAHYADDEYDYETDNILDYDCNYKTRKTKRKYSKKQCYNRKNATNHSTFLIK